MQSLFSERLATIVNNGHEGHLLKGLKGIEKESLRLTADGVISHQPHPQALGSALTHPHITTDYSEALVEMVTPAFESTPEALSFLHDTHQFVYQNIGDELLLATSMPCGIKGDDDVPIANYGISNIGKMKHVYRIGLGHRYGRSMQAISGVHFNYSIPESFWPLFQHSERNTLPLNEFINTSYMGLIRNIRRYSWLLTYLFGASPAFCQSFLNSRQHLLPEFDQLNPNTLYKPHATSLRMSKIGYQSDVQTSLKVCFNNLDDYIDDLLKATHTSVPEYTAIGIKVDGRYRQLNDSILQIENEYYSPVRPKQPIRSCEKPSLALRSRGIRYLELRMLDLNLSEPLGISEQQCRFLESFVLFCLLQPSPPHTESEPDEIRNNILAIADDGRNPDLVLQRNGVQTSVRKWAKQIFDAVTNLCQVLDSQTQHSIYSDAAKHHLEMIENPETTLSAQIIRQLQSTNQSFGSYALQVSHTHKDYFTKLSVDKSKHDWFKQLSIDSLYQQQQKEQNNTLTFDEFLHKYFNQTTDNPCV
ncbi:MAG TPA: glutamate--cysteine ligase [Crenotrichaceae bacterium]|nr:glutamate--cysteine ligase [Crenotrichaceae bacterium]